MRLNKEPGVDFEKEVELELEEEVELELEEEVELELEEEVELELEEEAKTNDNSRVDRGQLNLAVGLTTFFGAFVLFSLLFIFLDTPVDLMFATAANHTTSPEATLGIERAEAGWNNWYIFAAVIAAIIGISLGAAAGDDRR